MSDELFIAETSEDDEAIEETEGLTTDGSYEDEDETGFFIEHSDEHLHDNSHYNSPGPYISFTHEHSHIHSDDVNHHEFDPNDPDH